MPKTGRCAWCSKQIQHPHTGRPRKWCDESCRRRAYEQRKLDAAEEAGKQRAIEELRRKAWVA